MRYQYERHGPSTFEGIYDYRNRQYSPQLGRFLQTDPKTFKARDVNLYRYCWNNVAMYNDPFGLTPYFTQSLSPDTAENFGVSDLISHKIKKFKKGAEASYASAATITWKNVCDACHKPSPKSFDHIYSAGPGANDRLNVKGNDITITVQTREALFWDNDEVERTSKLDVFCIDK